MENQVEDEIRKRWEQEAKDKAEQGDESQQRSKKRVRAIEYQDDWENNPIFLQIRDKLEGAFTPGLVNGEPVKKGRVTATKKTKKATGAKGKGKVTELAEDEVIDLDG